jgi:hypothetical protein
MEKEQRAQYNLLNQQKEDKNRVKYLKQKLMEKAEVV